MGVIWNSYGALGLLALVAAWAMAFFVFAAAPRRRQNQYLALVLFSEGLFMGTGGGLMWLTDDAASSFAWQWFTGFGFAVQPFLYVLFLSTLETPLVAPFRRASVRSALGVLTAAYAVFLVVRPEMVVTWLQPGAGRLPWTSEVGPAVDRFVWLVNLTLVYALVAVLDEYRRARRRGAPARRARAFLTAFAVRDLGYLALLVFFVNEPLRAAFPPDVAFATVVVFPPSITLSFVGLLGYGILRTQLFGIELKLKFALRQSTVAGLLASVFFVVAELAEGLLGVEGTVQGLVAAGAIVLALHPVQRLARRAADAAMPGVEDTQAYRDERALELYRAAVADAHLDGAITAAERRVLDGLRERLGVDPGIATAIERYIAGVSP